METKQTKVIMKYDKIRLYVDMDNVLCDYTKAHNQALDENPDIKYPQSQYGFFRNLEEIEDAKKSYLYLTIFFDVHILTSPSVLNPFSYTEKRVWVEEHLGINAAYNMILAPNKSLLIGDYLIDDLNYSETNRQQDFTGQLIHFGGKDFQRWNNVINYFTGKYKLL